MARNAHWYDRNEQRRYPLADTAGGLPEGLIADLSLRFPRSLGSRAFVSGASVTDDIVTLLISAAGAPGVFRPLATLSHTAPFRVGRHLPLSPQADGVAGWVVLGRDAPQLRTRVSLDDTQGLLAPKAARAYRPSPVADVAKLFADTPLRGLVTLGGQAPLSVDTQTLTIDGAERSAVVFELVDQQQNLEGADPGSPLKALLGPCDGRPESLTCEQEGVQYLSGVAPDCNGRLTLVFQGCAVLQPVDGMCGVLLDCGTGLADVCGDPRVPAADGRLATEQAGDCLDSPYQAAAGSPDVQVDAGVNPSPPALDYPALTLPLVELFDSQTLPHLRVVEGRAGFAAEDPVGEAGSARVAAVDFGTAASSQPLEGVTGDWLLSGQSYTGAPAAGEAHAVAVAPLFSLPLPDYNIDGRLQWPTGREGTAGLVFDYRGLADFRFAGVAAGPDRWVLGSVSGGFRHVVAEAAATPQAFADLRLEVRGRALVLLGDGQERLSHELAAVPARSHAGLAALDAPAARWVGVFEVSNQDPAAASLTGVSLRNQHIPGAPFSALLKARDTPSQGRVASTQLKFTTDPEGASHNGGVLFGHEPSPTGLGLGPCHLAELNYEAAQIRVRRYDGTTWTTLATASAAGLQINQWTRLTLTIDGPNLQLEATGGAVASLTTTVTTPADPSQWGLYALDSATRFSELRITAT